MENPVRLRGHHLNTFSYFMLLDTMSVERGLIQRTLAKDRERRGYSPEALLHEFGVYCAICDDPCLPVVITDVPDCVCDFPCNKRNEECEAGGRLSEKDRQDAELFGLAIREEPYYSSEITRAIETRRSVRKRAI